MCVDVVDSADSRIGTVLGVNVGAPEIVLLELLFAALCAMIAARKGRFAIGWAVLGLLFGIFALIVVAVLPSRQATGRPVS